MRDDAWRRLPDSFTAGKIRRHVRSEAHLVHERPRRSRGGRTALAAGLRTANRCTPPADGKTRRRPAKRTDLMPRRAYLRCRLRIPDSALVAHFCAKGCNGCTEKLRKKK